MPGGWQSYSILSAISSNKICAIADLDMLLPGTDIVICALPGTRETAGLMGKARLTKMRRSAILINVGNGSILSCTDLAEIMKGARLRGSALDVTDPEPLPENSPLWDMDNVIVTPHIAGPSFSGDAHTAEIIWDICMDNLERYAADEPLRNLTDPRRGY